MNGNYKNLRRYLFEIIKNVKSKVIITFFLMLCGTICNLMQPQLIKRIIDQAIPDKRVDFLCILVILYGAISLVAYISNYFLEYLYSVMKRTISIKYKNNLLWHLTKMQGGYWSSKRTGELLKVLDDDVFNIENFGIETIFSIFSQIITALIALYLLVTMQPIILAVVIIIEYFEVKIQLYFIKKISMHTSEIREIGGNCFSILEEFVSNMINIIFSKCKRVFWHKLISREKEFKKKSIQLDMDIELSSISSSFLHTLIVLVIYLIGGYWTIREDMTLGTLVIYIEYVNMFTGPIYNIIRSNALIQQTNISLNKIYQILDENPEIGQNVQGYRGDEKIENIKFKNVSFSYEEGAEVLKQVNFSFEKGKIISIVGNTGCGKSTVVRLLYRLWEVTEGEILIGSVPIHEYNLCALRKQISVISQDVLIFNDTIWNNIVCGLNVEAEKVLKICKDVGVAEFALTMKEGYETCVGEKGTRLSGGQRQKIAVARALVTNGKIFIMDEATAAVDNISQNEIMSNIRPYLKEKIVIIIAHRMSVVKNTDKIYVMKKGECVGSGTHNELIKNCDEYKKLIIAEDRNTVNI